MIRLPKEFDDIRPYYDSEIPAAMERMASDPILIPVLKFLDRELDAEAFKARLEDRMRHAVGSYPALEADKLRELYLKIYAGPVYNSPSALKSIS